ncbi:hypothetical protein [Peribacillus muralis]|uniref:hypothetical protein n=1 Tax=Peribacillus muralis TaxID=264697 RepID=UPI00366C3DA8
MEYPQRNETDFVQILQNYGQFEMLTSFSRTEWNGAEGATLLREMRVYVRPRRLKAEEAHGPPLDKGVPAVQWNVHCTNHQRGVEISQTKNRKYPQ